MGTSVNGIVFPPGPLLLKHIGNDRYLVETKKSVKISYGPGVGKVVTSDVIRASEEHPCDMNGLVNIIKHNNNQVKIQQVSSGHFWQLGIKPFVGLVQPGNADITERHIFTPIQDQSTGQIHFKAYNGAFLSLADDNLVGTGKNYLHHAGAFLIELGVLKRVMRNIEYHLDKAHTVESVNKAGKALALDNPSNSVEQIVSRKHTETVTETSRWATSSTVATKLTISASVPVYGGSGTVSVEKSHEEEYELSTGSAVVKTLEIVDELSAKVPPAYKLEATMMVISGTINVPFSYSVTDYQFNGEVKDHGDKRFDDGMFSGVSLHTTIWDVNETHRT